NSSAILSDTGLESCIFTKYASRLTSSLLKNVVYSLKASALIGQVVLSLKRRTGLSSDAFQTSFKSPTSVNSFGSAIFIYLFLKVQIRFYTFNCFSYKNPVVYSFAETQFNIKRVSKTERYFYTSIHFQHYFFALFSNDEKQKISPI